MYIVILILLGLLILLYFVLRIQKTEAHVYYLERQKNLCQEYKTECQPPPHGVRVKISDNLSSGVMPIHGEREMGKKGSWILWAGLEKPLSEQEWKIVAINQLPKYAPFAIKYLGLPPGWCFEIDNKGYEKVWSADVPTTV